MVIECCDRISHKSLKTSFSCGTVVDERRKKLYQDKLLKMAPKMSKMEELDSKMSAKVEDLDASMKYAAKTLKTGLKLGNTVEKNQSYMKRACNVLIAQSKNVTALKKSWVNLKLEGRKRARVECSCDSSCDDVEDGSVPHDVDDESFEPGASDTSSEDADNLDDETDGSLLDMGVHYTEAVAKASVRALTAWMPMAPAQAAETAFFMTRVNTSVTPGSADAGDAFDTVFQTSTQEFETKYLEIHSEEAGEDVTHETEKVAVDPTLVLISALEDLAIEVSPGCHRAWRGHFNTFISGIKNSAGEDTDAEVTTEQAMVVALGLWMQRKGNPKGLFGSGEP